MSASSKLKPTPLREDVLRLLMWLTARDHIRLEDRHTDIAELSWYRVMIEAETWAARMLGASIERDVACRLVKAVEELDIRAGPGCTAGCVVAFFELMNTACDAPGFSTSAEGVSIREGVGSRLTKAAVQELNRIDIPRVSGSCAYMDVGPLLYYEQWLKLSKPDFEAWLQQLNDRIQQIRLPCKPTDGYPVSIPLFPFLPFRIEAVDPESARKDLRDSMFACQALETGFWAQGKNTYRRTELGLVPTAMPVLPPVTFGVLLNLVDKRVELYTMVSSTDSSSRRTRYDSRVIGIFDVLQVSSLISGFFPCVVKIVSLTIARRRYLEHILDCFITGLFPAPHLRSNPRIPLWLSQSVWNTSNETVSQPTAGDEGNEQVAAEDTPHQPTNTIL